MEFFKVIKMKKISYKVPDGKMLTIKLETQSGAISKILILGDFFLHPEEGISSLEKYLVGKTLDEEILAKDIDSFLEESNLTLIGADGVSLAKAIVLAYESNEGE